MSNFLIDYPWYQIIDTDEPLEQGDILNNVPIIVPYFDIASNELSGNRKVFDQMIVLSQSCDIQEKSTNMVILCPMYPLDSYLSEVLGSMKEQPKATKIKKWKDYESNKLRKGENYAFHLLNICKNIHCSYCIEKPYYIIELRNINSLPLDFIEQFSIDHGKRLRLLPPYREQLSQAFGRLFMRVGLPHNIVEFK
jgi:hypothetical protein